MTISAIVVDDETRAIDYLVRSINELTNEIKIVGTYTDPYEALRHIKENPPDIIFLDISMPHMDGFKMLSLAPNIKSEIIFITAHTEFALDAFNFDVSGYILKPIDTVRLNNTIIRVIQRVRAKEAKKTIIKSEGYTSKIAVPGADGVEYFSQEDIVYLEASGRYTSLHTINGRKIVSSYNLRKFKDVVGDSFMQVHRSFLVNLNHIKKYNGTYITVAIQGSEKEIPLSKNMRADFIALFRRNPSEF